MEIQRNLDALKEALVRAEPSIRHLLELSRGKTYLVGGALRDALLGREILDLDLAVEGEAATVGQTLAKELKGTFVLLDPERDEGRLVSREGPELDLSGLRDKPIEEDLRRRDFTIDALAIDLREFLKGEYQLIDPFGGVQDLSLRTIRMVADDSFSQDPVRILRAFRFAAQLGFSIGEETLQAMERDSQMLSKVPGERVWHELKLIFSCPDSFDQVEAAWKMGILEVLFPEMTEMRGVGQAKGHIQDLFEHSVLTYKMFEELTRELGGEPFAQAKEVIEKYVEPRLPLLKLSALFHDLGKPRAEAEDSEGVTHFYGHESIGVELAQKIAKNRLKLSRKETKTLTTLIANHMRPHLLAREEQLTQRAMRRFFNQTEGEGIGVLILAYADGLASRDRGGGDLDRTIAQLLSFHLEELRRPKLTRLITGDDLIQELKLKPSPRFRVILKEVEERQLEEEIKTREEALSLAKKIAEERFT